MSDLDKKYDLKEWDGIIFAEILWYVLNEIENVLKNLKEHYSGVLIVNQVFYYDGVQQYGRDFFTNQNELIDYFGLPVLLKSMSDDKEHENGYETHTVFDLRK